MRRAAVILVALLAVVVVGALVAGGGALSGGPGPTPTGTLAPVAPAPDVTADGSVVPVRSADLGVLAPGRVTFVAAEGATVASGTPVLRLDPAAADASLAAARAALSGVRARATQAAATGRQADEAVAVAKAQVAQAQALRDQARAERDQLPSGASSAQKRAARAALGAASAGLAAARAQVRQAQRAAEAAHAAAGAATADALQAQASVDEAAAARADLDVLAPFAGTVAFASPAIGELVTPGTPLVRIADPTGWRIETTDLDETAVSRFAVGAEATIGIDAFPGASFTGVVRAIRAYGEPDQGNIVYRVMIEPGGPLPANVRWNMTASVTIATK